jgi:cellulose biosynthesis protein BcsQ
MIVQKPSERVTIALVSGKGGVGKTMLSVAIARELSMKTRTLLFDLDFFNRGLTGLFRSGRVIAEVPAPSFISCAGTEAQEWELVEVAPKLLHVRYPDLTPQQIENLERLDACELADTLGTFLASLRSAADCDAIVLDCHGGPDRLSFAACMASNYALLISEPDKITFYGTMHFVRQLEAVIPPEKATAVDLRLVLNKVVPAFSGIYLRRFYNQELRDIFHGRPLLAIFPIEMYLTKEFERTPLLTEVYPFSLLAKKTRLLICDLLGKSGGASEHSFSKIPRWRSYFLRNSIGKKPWLFDLNNVLATIALCTVAFFALSWYITNVVQERDKVPLKAATNLMVIWSIKNDPTLLDSGNCAGKTTLPDKVSCVGEDPVLRYSITHEKNGVLSSSPLQAIRHQYLFDPSLRADRDQFIQNNFAALSTLPQYDRMTIGLYCFLVFPSYSDAEPGGALAMFGVVWFLGVLLFGWSVSIDRFFTYCWRTRHSVLAVAAVLLAAGLWFLPAIGMSQLIHDATPGNRWILWLFALPSLPIVWTELRRGYFNLRHEKRLGEATVRLLFLGYLGAVSFFKGG